MIFSILLDKNIMAKNAKVLIVSELANEYGMKDIGGMFHLFLLDTSKFEFNATF